MHGSIFQTGIVIPCYNEYHRLDINKIREFVSSTPDVLILFVDDGSKDNTRLLLNELEQQYSSVACYYLSKKHGKAEAVRLGILHLIEKKVQYVGYFDADFSTPLSFAKKFEEILKSPYNVCTIIMGSRIRRLGANIKRKPRRHFIGRIFATFASITLTIPVYDTQCGAKLFKTEIAKKIFHRKFISKWLFDVELIARSIIETGYQSSKKMILEYPLSEWVDDGKSSIKPADIFNLPFALLRLHLTYHKQLLFTKKAEEAGNKNA
ncbi:MAG: glycosyltransferase [Bacteroidetes bacterium]|jgi:glycosyltransferase involved in cell wall biosynthesis|nr:glycosyltransferase [Bacteroidota bacterium]